MDPLLSMENDQQTGPGPLVPAPTAAPAPAAAPPASPMLVNPGVLGGPSAAPAPVLMPSAPAPAPAAVPPSRMTFGQKLHQALLKNPLTPGLGVLGHVAVAAIDALGNMSTEPVQNGNPLAALGATAHNVVASRAAAADAAAKAKQQQIENDRADTRDKLLNAYTVAQTLATTRTMMRLDDDAQQKYIDREKAAYQSALGDHEPVEGETNLTPDEVKAAIASGKIDPAKMTPYVNGSKQALINGKMQEVPTTSWLDNSEKETKVDEATAAHLARWGQTIPAGTMVPQNVLDSAVKKATAAATMQDLLEQTDDKVLSDHSKLVSDEASSALRSDQALVTHYVGTHLSKFGDDPYLTLGSLADQKDPKTNQPTLEAQAAQRILAHFDPKELDTHRHNVIEERISQQNANIKAAEGPVSAAGGIMTDAMKAQIGALSKDKQAVISKYPAETQGALLAVAFGAGDVDFDKVFPARGGTRASGALLPAQTALGVLKQLNPNWSQQQYRLTTKAYADVTTGKLGNAIGQYNNVLQHGSEAQDVMENTWRSANPAVLNRPLNWIESHGWGTEAAKVQASLEPVKDEFSLLLSAGYKPSELEQKSYDSIFNPASTPSQIEAALKIVGSVGAIRLQNINQQYKRISGQDIPGILTKDSMEAAKHLNLDPDSLARLGKLNVGDTLFHNPNWKPASPAQVQKQDQDQKSQQAAKNAAIAAAAPAGATMIGMGSDKKMHYWDANKKDLGVVKQ
jgi:hypothetical protein